MKSIYLDQKELDNALAAIEEERRKERSAEETLQASVEHALEQCRRNLDNLTKLRYRELIGEEEFIRQHAELAQEERKLNERLEQLKTENRNSMAASATPEVLRARTSCHGLFRQHRTGSGVSGTLE